MLISVQKYAQKHGISNQTVYNNISWGLLKTAQKIKGIWMIDEDEPYPDHKRKKEVKWPPAPTDGYILLSEYATECGVPINVARLAAQRGEIPDAINLRSGWLVGSGPLPVSVTAYAKLHGLSPYTVYRHISKGILRGYKIGNQYYVDSPDDSQHIESFSGSRKRQSIVGETFGYLKVLQDYGNGRLQCLCKCGQTVEVSKCAVTTGYTRSCGCLRKEKASKGLNNTYMMSNGSYKYERPVFGRLVYFGTFTSPENAQQVKDQVEEIIAKYGSTQKALDLCLEIKEGMINSNVWEKETLVLITPEEIKEIRKGLNMTLMQFAELMGLSKNTISNWEKGLIHPYQQTQHKLVELKQNIAIDPTGTAQKAHDMLSNGKVLCEKEKRKRKVLITPKEIQAIQDMMGMDFVNFAIYLGVSRYTLYLWRNGDVHPCGENLSKLLELKKELDSLPPVERQEPPPEEIKENPVEEEPLTKEKIMQLKEAIEQDTLTPDKIKTLRKSANMSRKQFAEYVGVTIYAVIQWQSGKSNPRKRYKKKFLKLVQELLGEPETAFNVNQQYSDSPPKKKDEWPPPPSDGYITLSEYAMRCGVSIRTAWEAVNQGKIQGAVRMNKEWIIGTGDIPVSISEYVRLHEIPRSTVLWCVRNGKLPGYRIGKSWYVVSPEDSKKVLVNRPNDWNKNLVGQAFGYLTVLEDLGHNRLRCECKCKRIVEVAKSSVVSGNTRSCGCLRNRVKIKDTDSSPSKEMETINPEDIALIRRALNMNMVTFAELIGVIESQVSRWEKGTAKPTKKNCYKLLEIKKILDQSGSPQDAIDRCLQIKAEAGETKVRKRRIRKKKIQKPKREEKEKITPEDVKAIRAAWNMSIRVFAAFLGVSKTTVLHWEHGETIRLEKHLDRLLKLKQDMKLEEQC